MPASICQADGDMTGAGWPQPHGLSHEFGLADTFEVADGNADSLTVRLLGALMGTSAE